MKKVRIIILFMTLFLGMFFFIPIRVSAYTYIPGDAIGLDFTPYKDNIVFVRVDLEADFETGPWFYAGKNPIYWSVNQDPKVYVYIKEFATNKGFQFNINTDFSPLLESEIRGRLTGSYYYTGSWIKTEYGREGMYWNPWLQIWQLGYPINPDVIMTAEDWINHISQFDFGYAYGEINDNGDITILEEPSHEFDGWFIDYNFNNGDIQYFEPELVVLEQLSQDGENIFLYLEENFEDFDGYLYWNFEQGYWQVEYYEFSELDYYKQRVDEIEDEIQQLENQIQQLENEKQQLENQIQQLEGENQQLLDEIQQLENEKQQLETENQQLLDEIQQLENEKQQLEDEIQQLEGENNDIDIIKWFVPLVVIIIVVGIFETIKIFKRSEK